MKNSFGKSLKHAFRGVSIVFFGERNFRIQVIFAVLVLCSSWFFQIKIWEFVLVVLLIGAVLTLELLNSVIERIADGMSPRLTPIIRDIKDLMAGAVLMAALVAAVIGVFIFYPYLFDFVANLFEYVGA